MSNRVVWVTGAAFAAAVAMATPASAQSAAPTFTKDVAPIFYKSCVKCHRTGESAPMSLMTYEEARPWARSIKTRVVGREMPPWHIDRNIGIQKFKDDPSLSDAEIQTVAKWVDAGAPRGNPSDLPPAPTFASNNEWQIGKPDLIVRYPVYKMPAASPDHFGSLYTKLDLTEDRYIKAVETRPVGEKSRKVVHHALTFTVSPDAAESQSDGDDSVSDGGQFLVEYASGKNAEVYPDGSGVLLKKGEKARLSYHTHSWGEDTYMEVEVGMKLYPKGYVPPKVRWSKQLAQPTAPIDVPPGTVARSDGYVFMHKPAKIIAFQPHLHLLGTRQCLELIYPTTGASARTEVVNCINFNNSWHLSYNYQDDVAPIVPAGTVLHNIQWHDNTAGNPRASDPRNWVGNGNRTVDEMGFFWLGWIELTDEEYRKELAERQARNKDRTATTQQQ